MRRIALLIALIAACGAGFAATATGDDSHTYFIELDNAFGLTNGSEVKVAGVAEGTVQELLINSDKRAVIKVQLSGPLSVLGEDTVCSSEPQSLIAEYFIDCVPKGDPLVENEGSDDERIENPDIPVDQTRQTVQTDLVQSALRMPFRDRLTLIINEFGTALAGNPENLNDAIRRGAPALEAAKKVTGVLADQNTIIRDLNANSDAIITKLNDRSADVVSFIKNARATADVGAAQRENLSKDFELLDNFLAELQPTMVKLNDLAVAQTPLLRDLGVAAPGLTTLSRNLPDFNRAAAPSIKSLGKAAVVGKTALDNGDNEIKQLADSSKKAFSVADNLSKFLRDIDDPRRAVEIDARAGESTGRTNSKPGKRDTMGYTGMEGLLNYVFYQAGAISQYDTVSHLLHFSIFEVGSGPCASYNGGQTVPSASGGETTDAAEANRCVAWLGPNQPGINSGPELPPYDGSVCPGGSTDLTLCDPANTSARKRSGLTSTADDATAARGQSGSGGSGSPAGAGGDSGPGSSPDSGSGSGVPDVSGGAGDIRDALPGGLDDILGGGSKDQSGSGGSSGLGGLLGKRSRNSNGGSGAGSAADSAAATGDLLGYLFDN